MLLAIGVLFSIAALFLLTKVNSVRPPEVDRERVEAVRIFDSIKAFDDAIPTLPVEVKREVEEYLNRYYRTYKP